MFNDTLDLQALVAALNTARELSQLTGNVGKKVRLALEALLRDGVIIVAVSKKPLIVAGQAELVQDCCLVLPGVRESGFDLAINVASVERSTGRISLRLTTSIRLETLRTRQQLLAEIAERLGDMHDRLRYSAPLDTAADVLLSVEASELCLDEQEQETVRLQGLFTRLLEHDFTVLEEHETPLRVIDLASLIDPAVAAAAQASFNAQQPSIRELLAQANLAQTVRDSSGLRVSSGRFLFRA